MINWKDLPDHSHIWIYQANRILTEEEISELERRGEAFLAGWNSHGKDMQAGIKVFNQLHLVVMVDERHASASGCSIDSSVHFVKEVGEALKVDFFDRILVAVEQHDGVLLLNPTEQKARNILTMENAIVYDNTIKTLGELKTEWLKPVQNTWVQQYIS